MPWLAPDKNNPLADLFEPKVLAHWRKLALAPEIADSFCSAPDWSLAFHAVFSPERPVYYAVSEQGLILFGYFFSDTGTLFLLPLEDSWIFGQNILGLEAPFLLAACLEEIKETLRPQKLVAVLGGVQMPSLMATSIFQKFRDRYRLFREQTTGAAIASLEGGFDGWLARRSANHRAKLRKASRKAREQGVSFERHRPAPAQVAGLYQRVLAVEAQSWKGQGRCGMAESPAREFYERLLGRLAQRREALLIFARQAGEDVGFIFGGLAGPVYRGQQFSYRADIASLSIGNLLQMAKIRWLCELGVERYDMGPITGPRMEYKKHWVEQRKFFHTWSIRSL